MEIVNRITPASGAAASRSTFAWPDIGKPPQRGCPDCVGDQDETLKRLALYRPELQQLAELGAQVIIPLQVGARIHEEFYAEATAVAGVPLVPAFTMKKAATSEEDAARFLRRVKPARIHLLGMGRENFRAPRIVAMIHACSPSRKFRWIPTGYAP